MKTNPIRWSLHWQILAALALAALFGFVLMPLWSAGANAAVARVCGFLGSLFLNALKMIIVPLIVASIISGVMRLGAEKGVGRLGFKTLLYYTASGGAAVVVGLLVVNLVGPGRVDPETAAAMLGRAGETAGNQGLLASVEGRGGADMVDIFLRMFPPNVVEAASDNGQLLGVIVFSILFGLFIGRLPPDLRQTQERFWDGAQRVMLHLAEFIIRFAPVGVFGLVTPVLFQAPVEELVGAMLAFFLTVLLSLGLHFFLSLGLALRFVAKVDPRRHYRCMSPVLLTAFSTASSSATLPLTLDTVEERAGVSNKTCAFTLPLGATVNMDGTALYECVVVLFIAQLFAAAGGVPLGLGQQALVVLLALATSVGVAGIPAASLVAIAVILPAVGLPVEAIGVVWVTDRILDMCRTAVNVFSDTVGAVVIGRSEGETPYATDHKPNPLPS